ncbi:Beta-glucosidase 11 [Vitis vinifera]|uniref:Beta-glucosidase 11 n=1 Tax=Vitis vinifera TaxID=29760 RepID=A0A438KHB9_VITVI|nr:Beta-glucosidase 11 [Vitis vinifera]
MPHLIEKALHGISPGQRTQRNTSLNDTGRVKYLQGYIGALLNAVTNLIKEEMVGINQLQGLGVGASVIKQPVSNVTRLKKNTVCSLSWGLFGAKQTVFTAFSSLKFSRDDFPLDFIFGSGTSAYQEQHSKMGGPLVSGIPLLMLGNIYPIAISDEQGFLFIGLVIEFSSRRQSHGATGDITSDQYHKYKEYALLMLHLSQYVAVEQLDDVKLMVETGLEAYRFSISWSRLIPNGRGPVNPKGLAYYNNLINELLSHVESNFCHICFLVIILEVLYWSTINEGNIFALGGYDIGLTPPQRCSPPFGNCPKGNSPSEPYIAGHHILLAHASVTQLYREKYQDTQQGFIGTNVFAYWFVPLTNKTEDIIATQRAHDFFLVGEFVHVLVFGDYPDIVKKRAGTRIPSFTEDESKQVKGSFDFIGINHYTSVHIKNNPMKLNMDYRDFNADVAVDMIASLIQFPVLPWGLQQLLEYFKQVYGNPPTYIHENGLSLSPPLSLCVLPLENNGSSRPHGPVNCWNMMLSTASMDIPQLFVRPHSLRFSPQGRVGWGG